MTQVPLIVTLLLDSIQYASFLFVVSLGLTVTFGVMRVLNLANGSIYAWGAYAGALTIGLLVRHGYSPTVALLIGTLGAAMVGAILGLLIEAGLLRFLYGLDEVIVVIATFGLYMALENLLLLVFGAQTYLAYEPMASFGTIKVFGVTRDVYGLCLILVAAIAGGCTWLILMRTGIGRLVRAVIFDPEISGALGVRVRRVFAVTFAAGCALSALAGGLIAPTVSVSPGFSLDVIVLSLALIVIGGLGSIPGAMIGALIVGFMRALAIHFFAELEFFAVFAAMVLVLLFRPEGLVPLPKPRRI
jgi:branched-chain amino acid transport system permease protein